jgi:hypothetical protein
MPPVDAGDENDAIFSLHEPEGYAATHPARFKA